VRNRKHVILMRRSPWLWALARSDLASKRVLDTASIRRYWGFHDSSLAPFCRER